MMLPILFSSHEAGAPVLNNAAGALIGVLDACLVTGFNVQNIASVAVSGGVATVTTNVAHGYLAQGMNNSIGQATPVANRVTLSGFANAALNAAFAVQSVPSSTTFTINVALPDGSYTGSSLQAKRTPLGWAKAFAGTKKAIYRPTDPMAFGNMLRVVNDGDATYAKVMGVASATDIDTFTGRFPSDAQQSGGGAWNVGMNDGNAKNWFVIGDWCAFYWAARHPLNSGDGSRGQCFFFGDLVPVAVGDVGATLLACGNGPTSTFGHLGRSFTPFADGEYLESLYLAQHQSLPQQSLLCGMNYPYTPQCTWQNSTVFPAAVADLNVAMPVLAMQQASAGSAETVPRGVVPGLASTLHRDSQMPRVANSFAVPVPTANGLFWYMTCIAGSDSSTVHGLTVNLTAPWR